MVVSSLPPTTTNAAATQQGGIIKPDYNLPSMPAVTGGAQNYENRMAATQSLMQAGNGNLAGGGYRRRRNHVTKVMKGCSSKKTRRNNKNKRHKNRLFRGVRLYPVRGATDSSYLEGHSYTIPDNKTSYFNEF